MSSRLVVNSVRHTGASADGITLDASGNVTFPANATCSGTASGFGGGKILQVISSNKTTVQSTTSTSYVDVTDMTATITPAASSSKILILISFVIQKSDYTFFAQLLRDSTVIGTPATGSNSALTTYNSNNQNQNEGRAVTFLDSPNTTNATTYKLQMKSDGSSTIYFGAHSSGTTNDYISLSSITLMEVAA